MDSMWATLIIPLLCLLFIVSAYLLLRKKWTFAFISSSVLILLNCWTESVPLGILTSNVNGKIKIITWNIHSSGPIFDSVDSVKSVAELVLESCADIVCLQEYTPQRCGELESLLKIHYPYMAYMDNFEKPRNVNAIFSKYPIAYSNTIEMHSSDKEILTKEISNINPFRKVSRKMLLQSCVILADNRRLGLLNCHFASNKYDDENIKEEGLIEKLVIANMIRKINAAYARDFVESCQGDGIPVIVCGDLNDFSGSKSLGILQKEGKLKNCWWEKGCGLGFTFHSHGWMYFRLDHILHSEGLKCTSVNVVKQDFSDHDALFATFNIE